VTSSLDSLTRFYDLGKKGQWNAADVPWHLPLVPDHRASERRREVWRSIITQQYQADLYAVQAAAQFVVMAQDHPAQLYYSVMAQDEARHVEVWSRMAHAFGGPAEFDPYLAEMGQWVLEAQEIELKIIPLQVFFEGMAISAFREIAQTVPDTVLGDVCTRLAKDDSIHHGFGYAYAGVLLERASPAHVRYLSEKTSKFWPLYKAHVLWRPKARAWMAAAMKERDREILKSRATFTRRMISELGLSIEIED
jgi:hypothetical protein